MIGLLIVTHETLGHAFSSLVSHFFGPCPDNVRLLNVAKDDTPDIILERASALIHEVNQGQGVLILTDIFGATPCNISRKLIQSDDVMMLTGLNAPMMVKAIQYASKSNNVHELATTVQQAAINGIMNIDYHDVSHCDAETRS